ncbi:MAG: hypothetical protein VCA13_04505 [PS1 clade bacterium]
MKKIIYFALIFSINAQALQLLQSKDGHETVKQKLNLSQSEEIKFSPDLSPKQLLLKLEKLAKNEDPRAQYSLANMYHDGINVEVDTMKAFYWYERVAEKGFPSAQFIVANGYFHGLGGITDLTRARSWHEKAAEQNYVAAQYNLAVMYRNGEGGDVDNSKAYYWYDRAANLGYPQAQLILAKLTESGIGTEKNIELAEDWYMKAVSQSDPEAQYYLADYYQRNGELVKARVWYEKSAEQHYSSAQFSLAEMLRLGEGGDRDEGRSVYWYESAASYGNLKAQLALDSLSELTKDIEEDEELYVVSVATEGAQPNQESLFYLAKSYERNSEGDKAIEIYNDLAENGFLDAQSHLAHLYRRGQLIEQNDFNALHWALIAAENGDADAQFLSGVIYRNSSKIAPDLDKAIYWYKRSADQDNSEAQYRLYKIYSNGEIININEDLSLMYLVRAAENEHSAAQQELIELNSREKEETPNTEASKSNDKSNSDVTINTIQSILPADFEQTLLEQLSQDPGTGGNHLSLLGKTSAPIPAKEEIAESLSRNKIEMTNLEKLVLRAKQGSPVALHNLSRLFSVGALVQKDDRKAFKLMQEAAVLGLSKSQNSLAIMYIRGNGVDYDINKAIYWARSSAQQGDEQGRKLLLRLMMNNN